MFILVTPPKKSAMFSRPEATRSDKVTALQKQKNTQKKKKEKKKKKQTKKHQENHQWDPSQQKPCLPVRQMAQARYVYSKSSGWGPSTWDLVQTYQPDVPFEQKGISPLWQQSHADRPWCTRAEYNWPQSCLCRQWSCLEKNPMFYYLQLTRWLQLSELASLSYQAADLNWAEVAQPCLSLPIDQSWYAQNRLQHLYPLLLPEKKNNKLFLRFCFQPCQGSQPSHLTHLLHRNQDSVLLCKTRHFADEKHYNETKYLLL